jgi:uncharacterized protein YciI
MYYAIFLKDNGTETPAEALKAHRDFLVNMNQQNKIVMAGRMENNVGLLICNAASKDEAEALAEADPFVSGNYRDYEVLEWNLSVG